MKSTLVRKSRKSKKSAHMQGIRRSGDERLWRDELTLLNRSNSSRLLPSYSTLQTLGRALVFAVVLLELMQIFPQAFYSTNTGASRRLDILLQPYAARSLAYNPFLSPRGVHFLEYDFARSRSRQQRTPVRIPRRLIVVVSTEREARWQQVLTCVCIRNDHVRPHTSANRPSCSTAMRRINACLSQDE
jgi:hypothetical protein